MLLVFLTWKYEARLESKQMKVEAEKTWMATAAAQRDSGDALD